MTTKISRVIVLTVFLSAFCFIGARAQDTIVRSVNNEFAMEIHRDSAGINVFIYPGDPSKFTSIIVEKGQWSDGEFRQCGDVDMKNQSASAGPIEVKDNYPLNAFYDTYYRVRAITSDGSEKIYPALLLPGKVVPVHKIHF